MPKLKEVAPRVRVGHGFTRQNMTIFPLLADEEAAAADYVTVGAAIRAGTVKVSETSEAGSVPKLAIDNLGIIPILIIDGEELVGARQNRIANLTVLVPGKKSIPVPVSCVERGRWGYMRNSEGERAADFTDSPQVMHHSARARKSRDITQSLFTVGVRMADQAEVWDDISRISAKMGFVSPTHAMADLYDDKKRSIDEYLADVNVMRGQVGAVFAINGRPVGIELFDSPETLATYLPKIMRSYALDALANQMKSPKTAKEGEALHLLDSVLELEARSFPAVGLGEDLRIESKEITGGALSLNGRVIHLAAFSTAINDN